VFGPHLIIDGSHSDIRKLADRILVEQILNGYPAAIGMTKIGGPYMFEYQAPDPAYSGISGLVVIAESHIAIHTFPALDYFTMDIFSCKNFDHEKAIAYIKEAFDVQEMDRMLVQRGLSFRGPHHGKHGASDELIAAAEARLAAGIVSKEPALPDEPATGAALGDERATHVARRLAATPGEHIGDGHMLWPQYGVTPDYGTYGPFATPAHRDGAVHDPTVSRSRSEPRRCPTNASTQAIEPVLVNPTASLSGLFDKLTTTSGAGRAMGRALAEWERFARDPECTIALMLSTPVIAAGLREVLVYAVERHLVDVVVVSGDDLFADACEALGHHHTFDGRRPVLSEEGRGATREALLRLLAEMPAGEIATPSQLCEAFGAALPTCAPRKGLLQAAVVAGVRVYSADLPATVFGDVLLAARARGVELTLDATEETMALGRHLAQRPHLGAIQVGSGPADALLDQARGALPLLGLSTPELLGTIAIDEPGSVPAPEEGVVSLSCGAELALPLLMTGLAQRIPAVCRPAMSMTPDANPAEPALT
jgi:S-adenosylmethionine decarboxylase